MTASPRILAVVLAAACAAPAAAQYPYPYPQPYPQQPYPGQPYPGQPYPYPGQPYGSIGSIIDQLLGNRYSVTDRTAVRQCASAAVTQAQNQIRGYGGYQGQYPYNYNQPYGGVGYGNIRVTAITDVERRSNGLRIRGLLDSGMYAYNQNYNRGYAASGDLTFRCNVDYRGYVTDVRVNRNDNWRRY